MSFLTAGSGYNKRKTNNIASQFEPIKQRWRFETGGKNNNNALDLSNNKYKCANERCLSIFTAGLLIKIYWFYYYN